MELCNKTQIDNCCWCCWALGDIPDRWIEFRQENNWIWMYALVVRRRWNALSWFTMWMVRCNGCGASVCRHWMSKYGKKRQESACTHTHTHSQRSHAASLCVCAIWCSNKRFVVYYSFKQFVFHFYPSPILSSPIWWREPRTDMTCLRVVWVRCYQSRWDEAEISSQNDETGYYARFTSGRGRWTIN